LSLAAPPIRKLANTKDRPTWSVMIPSYNCANYLRRTLTSVLDQALPPAQMQIEVVDDCSTDDEPDRVVSELASGRVSFHRHPANVGAIANFNSCIERSTGHLVQILHGDDYVLPDFYATVSDAFERWQDVAGVFTRCLVVDENDELEFLSSRLKDLEGEPSRDGRSLYYDNLIRTPGAVVRRSFYEQFGGFIPSLIHTADWEMWLRVVVQGSAVAINQPLAAYREFPGSHTGQLVSTGENVRDWLRMAEACAPSLPGFDMHQFRAAAAVVANRQSEMLRQAGDVAGQRANRKLWRQTAPPSERARRFVGRSGDEIRGLLATWWGNLRR
jgi:hypothetical protein